MSRCDCPRTGRSTVQFHVLNALIVLAAMLAGWPALAQDAAPLQPGEAYATRFSGTAVVDGVRVIDRDGTVGSILDIRTPGQPPRGEHWWNEPQRLPVTARQVGQVFGVALDDASPPNVYVTATAAFGLHRSADNARWMPGMWGTDGGPGTVYKLSAENGYRPEVFATIQLAGRANTGAALGNIAFDPWHRQLLVSDMETGMVHRLDLEDGTEIGHYDHGSHGRTAFFDAAAAARVSLEAVAFDPDSRAQVYECEAGPFANTPDCWNVADFRRRVWGLGVHRDAESGDVRLYYAVWGSQAFGNPDWADAGEDKRNSVWSVGLLEDGAFDLGDVRREFFTPAFFSQAGDLERHGASHPVSDIAFQTTPGRNVMVLAERGGLRNLGLDRDNAFATPHGARVLRYELGEDGQWLPAGRYDVGFYDRRDEGQPYLRANSSGGIAFGYGYGPSFEIDPDQPDMWLWATGDSLCSPEGLCFDSSADAHTDSSQVHGLQGMAELPFDLLLPEAALATYPAEGPATAPETPDRAAMIDLDINVDASGNGIEAELTRNDATRPGDVEIYQLAAGIEEYGEDEELIPGDEVPPGDDVPPGDLQGFDLEIDKFQPADCAPGIECRYRVTITNNGPDVFEGPVFFQDGLPDDAVYLGFIAPGFDPGWSCEPAEDWVNCRHDFVTLEPGESLSIWLVIALPDPGPGHILLNCVDILWPMADDETEQRVNLWVEEALNLEGYPVGPVDGVIDPATSAAILDYQHDHGLAETGTVTEELRAALFPGSAGERGDLVPENDHDCTELPIGPLPPEDDDGDEPGDEEAEGPGDDGPAPVALELGIVKQAVGPCHPGAECLFDITVTNHSTETAYDGDIMLREIARGLREGGGVTAATYLRALTGTWNCAGDASVSRCSLDDVHLGPGESGTLRVAVDLPAGFDDPRLENCASFVWEDMAGGPDGDDSNDEGCATVDVGLPVVEPAPMIDLGIEIDRPEACTRGERCRFDTSTVNNGPGDYTGSVMTTRRYILVTETGEEEVIVNVEVAYAARDIPSGTAYRYGLTPEVPDDPAYVAVRACEILDPEGSGIIEPDTPEARENNNVCANAPIVDAEEEEDAEAEDEGPVHGGFDIGIEGHSSCERGTTCRDITLTIDNRGDETYSGPLGLRGTLRPGVPILSVEATGGWTCNVLGGSAYNCHNPGLTLAPGAGQTVRLVVDIPRSFSGSRLRHTMQVIWPGHDPDSPPPEGVGDGNPVNDRDGVWVTITDPVAAPMRCQNGTVVGKRCVCRKGFQPRQLKPNFYRCVKIPPREEAIQCVRGAVVDGTCVCKQGWTLKRTGKRAWRCIPPKPPATQIECVKGSIVAGRCVCRKGWTLKRTAARAWRCIPPKPPARKIQCVNGSISGGRCVCKKGWTLKRTGARAWRCYPPKPPAQKIRCVNGAVVGGKCVCKKGWTLKRTGARTWRCIPPQARPLRCSGGKVVNGRCVCPRGKRPRRVGKNFYRCVNK